MRQQPIDDGVEPLQHVGVANAHDLHALRRQVLIALAVLGAARLVHHTVHLDREP
jgi:hypothetical protein